MNDTAQERGDEIEKPPSTSGKAKKPYSKPAFEHESVFETMALACGKLSPTQLSCKFNRKNS